MNQDQNLFKKTSKDVLDESKLNSSENTAKKLHNILQKYSVSQTLSSYSVIKNQKGGKHTFENAIQIFYISMNNTFSTHAKISKVGNTGCISYISPK